MMNKEAAEVGFQGQSQLVLLGRALWDRVAARGPGSLPSAFFWILHQVGLAVGG